jgi:hypothetical protein
MTDIMNCSYGGIKQLNWIAFEKDTAGAEVAAAVNWVAETPLQAETHHKTVDEICAVCTFQAPLFADVASHPAAGL